MAKMFAVETSSIVVVALAIQGVLPTSVTEGITFVGALTTLVTAIFFGWVTVIAAKAAARNAIAPVAAKVDKIEAHVNSEKTRDQGVIAAKDIQIELQKNMIEELKRMSALLAQAQATRDLSQAVAQAAVAGATSPTHAGFSQVAPVSPAAQAVVSGPATVILKEIEKQAIQTAGNTQKIAENTQKTDDTVQEIQKDQKDQKDAQR